MAKTWSHEPQHLGEQGVEQGSRAEWSSPLSILL